MSTKSSIKIEKIEGDVKVGGLEYVWKLVSSNFMNSVKHPNLYARFKLPNSRFYMFYGPPGCGKTVLGRFIAKTNNIPFISVDSSSLWMEKVKVIFEAFELAKKNAPCVLLITSGGLDLSNCSRFDNKHDTGVHDALVSRMKDLKESKANILFILETTRPDVISNDVVASINDCIYIPLPDYAARFEMLKIFVEGLPIEKEAFDSLNQIAKVFQGFSGSDIEDFVRKTSQLVVRRQLEKKEFKEGGKMEEKIRKEDFEEAAKYCRKTISEHEMRKYEMYAELRYSSVPRDIFETGKKDKGDNQLVDEILDDGLYD